MVFKNLKRFLFVLVAISALAFTAMGQSTDPKPKVIDFGGVFVGAEYQEQAQRVFKDAKKERFAAKVGVVFKIAPIKKRVFNLRFDVVQPASNVEGTFADPKFKAPFLRFSIDTRIL
jgi:hypothetical protein